MNVLPAMNPLAKRTPVRQRAFDGQNCCASDANGMLSFIGLACKRSELPPPLSSNLRLKARNTPALKVCEPRIHDKSSRPLYRFSPLLQGAIICGVPPLAPRLMVGTPTLCAFKSAGNKVGKSAVSVAVSVGLLPPGVMRMRLLE